MIESSKRPKIVGNFIRQRREALNLSQRALGLLFDPPVTTQFISNVERGVTPLPPAHVPTLTKALQVSEAELMGLLEKEYTSKLSGRLGLPQDAVLANGNGNGNGHHSGMTSSPEYDFIQSLYQAYTLADSQTRKAFAGLCQSMLGLRVDPAAVTTTDGQVQPSSQSQQS